MIAAQHRHWAGAAGLALLLHAPVLLPLLWSPAVPPAPAPAAVRMVMLLSADDVQAPAAAATPLPPGPSAPQGSASDRMQTRRTEPATSRPVPRPQPTPPPQPHEQGQLDAAAAAAVGAAVQGAEQPSAPPASTVPAGPRVQAPQDSSGSGEQAMVLWQMQLLGHLERHKRYPRQAQRRREQGVAQVQFAVDRQGGVRDVRLLQGSGVAVLDGEALAVMQRAAPVPAPPAALGDAVRVVVPVTFFLDRR